MKSFFDDLLDFGSGALDSVGEHANWLFGIPQQSANPNTVQQPNHPRVDDRGNTVTQPMGAPAASLSPMLLYAGGGLALTMVFLLLFLALKK